MCFTYVPIDYRLPFRWGSNPACFTYVPTYCPSPEQFSEAPGGHRRPQEAPGGTFLCWDVCSGSASGPPPPRQEAQRVVFCIGVCARGTLCGPPAPKRPQETLFHIGICVLGTLFAPLPRRPPRGSDPWYFTAVPTDCPSPVARILCVLRMSL